MGPWSNNFEGNPFRVLTMLLLHIGRCLKEQLNIMLLQESQKVTKTVDVEQKLRFTSII